ncbi:S-methyl-5-thioribose kinase [soil metagenome]|jgi:5-methylthioribose kinase
MSDRYVPLDVRSVLAFAAPFLEGQPVEASEIGDGNLNLVFRVRSDRASVIVKQALPYLRIAGDAWPLTRHRARIEADAIEVHEKLAPGLLPRTLHFDTTMSALVFEDLSEHITWREALIAAQPTDGVAETVGRYCAAVILGTSDVLLPSRQRKVLRRDFVYSELCLVTEDLIFTAPYLNAPSNRYDPEIADAAEALRHDRALRSAAAEMRFSFKTRDEALIHGDLHSGSVMTKPGDTRVIDLEFAFFGPFGFDPGVLLANLALSRLAHDAAGNYGFSALVDQYAQLYWAALTEEIKRLWNPTEPWHARFLSQFLRDASRFAGMEMIRRIVGLAHAKDIDSLAQPARAIAQHRALGGGRALMLGTPVHTFEDLWQRAVGEDNFA